MKLLRCGEPGAERPGSMQADGTFRDPSHVVANVRDDAPCPEELAGASAYADNLPRIDGSDRQGAWFATPDEVPDPQGPDICPTVDGKTMRNASTSTVGFGVGFFVSDLTRFMSLHPGDVVGPSINRTGRRRQDVVARA